MKFELKTENDNNLKSFSQFFGIVFFLTLLVILCDVALKFEIISKNHRVEYNCRILSVVKSKPHFKKLSRLSNLKSKQQIWEFCREVIK